MNERFSLDSPAIRAWLKEGERKQAYLTKALRVSRATVARMLNEAHVPEDPRVTRTLAALMGITEQQLLIPKEAKAG